MKTQSPNILYLHSHDTGRYIQPYGYAVPTPNLQRLAEKGILFRQAFCAAPTCSPSRAALLTGQSAHSSGMLGLAHRGFALTDPRQHILYTLRDAGYRTALVGIQHVANDSRQVGHDEVLAIKEKSKDAHGIAEAAVEFLWRTHDRPFFLDVGFFETHRVFPEPGPEDDARYIRPPAPLPDGPETRKDMAGFCASARILDNAMGRVLDALEQTGLAANTLVICTTDHGPAFPDMKCNLTDHGMGVMLLMRGPGGFEGGKVSDALVSHIDLFPTVCDLIGIRRPGWLQGESILPLVRGEKDRIREELFAEVTYHAAYEPMRCVRTERWKYIRRFHDREQVVLPNCDDGPSKAHWLQHDWTKRLRPREELYDVVFDPAERHNLADDARRADVLKEMRQRLARWMRATDDPLLRGPVPPPPGAKVTSAEALSPTG